MKLDQLVLRPFTDAFSRAKPTGKLELISTVTAV
jgi:hypothetical protein